jgi:mRNA-degrading endonuclease toxin of MazEF toxin-antitoxin module
MPDQAIHRGDVWRYKPVIPRPGISTLRLVISPDQLNASQLLPVVLAVHIIDESPDSPLAPRIGELGWAPVTTIERAVKSRLIEHVSIATADEIRAVEEGLRIILGL